MTISGCFALKHCQEHVEQKQNDLEWNGVTLEWKGVDNKSEKQPWPQLVHCASICCYICGYVFQENWIATRSLGEKWYIDKSEDRIHKKC